MPALRMIGTPVLVLFTIAPWAWMFAFAVMFTLAVVQFGHFPSYGNPDPKQVEGSWLPYWVLFLLFFPSVLSPLVAGGETVWRLARKAGLRARALAVYLLGFALFGSIMFVDAFGLRNWILD